MSDMVWEEPSEAALPVRQERYTATERVADLLRSRPGEWALVSTSKNKEGARLKAASIVRGQQPAFAPAGTFEAVVDGADFRQVKARFVGDYELEDEEE